MSALYLLPLLLSQVVAEPGVLREPPVRFGPCGVYDIGELEDHFLVEVTVRPAEADPERVEVRITLVETAPAGDLRRPLPIAGLSLQVRDADKKVIASTPIRWDKPEYSVTGDASRQTTLIVSPAAAKQVVLNREPILRWIDEPHLLVTFASLGKAGKPEGG